ncbi:metallophosphoesterase [Alkalicoccobacillus porphyridii]|uniref:Metallophosphoesterase n=1 Tax=Alkalicoccobacillus porphyridii TaxID=2597270 RepID=A0A554A0H2_9BACI|nr:metallophosphoesterase [Alkalicoccobacillus porphyridii]TSB47188.1 metallophosphoesterase [Alkalicoccobacillus porphyridii]
MFIYYQQNTLSTTHLSIESNSIPNEFNDYKIIHLSDLHNKIFGRNQDRLAQSVEEEQPDLIVFTGDLIDSRRYDANPAIQLIEKLTDLAPVYYVTGNHEWHSNRYDELQQQLTHSGAVILENESVFLEKGDASIQLAGIEDPAFSEGISNKAAIETGIRAALSSSLDQENYTILLSHRPEHFLTYSAEAIDVVLAGHAHGGQIRIPFLGGLIAPDQGFFPTYTSGPYESNGTTMIVNRGLGNSVIPIRLFNRPEIVSITLSRTTK